MRIILFVFLLSLSSTPFAKFSKVPSYPTGVKVSFTAPGPAATYSNPTLEAEIKELEDSLNGKLSWFQKKSTTSMLNKKLAQYQEEKKEFNKSQKDVAPKNIKYKRFIRVVSSITPTGNNNLAILFYNKNGELIQHMPIEKSVKPSPRNISFMDRASGNKFHGKIDLYAIPDETSYIQFGTISKDGKVSTKASHPDFDSQDRILISEYNKLPSRPTMIQVELLGTEDKIFTRLGAFYFV